MIPTSAIRTAVSTRSRGFTLIEVLVVVAIIALLVAILIPSLKAAREQAKRVDCASNLHQIGVGVNLYSNAHKDDLPVLYRTTSAFTTYYVRSGSLGTVNLGLIANARYAANEPQLFYCTGQSRVENASLTFNGPDNQWYSDKEYAALSPPKPQVRCSYPARLIEVLSSGSQIGGSQQWNPMPAGQLVPWKVQRFSKHVIYSDFTGVSGYQGGGIEMGMVSSPHEKKGFNVLFANAAARWVRWDVANKLRPITADAPTPEEQVAYYKALDRAQ